VGQWPGCDAGQQAWGRAKPLPVAVAAAALTACGLVGLAVSGPWLFPGLGPIVMVLVERPRAAAAAPRNVLLGHLAGIAVGCSAWP